jgi:hypothetical protein
MEKRYLPFALLQINGAEHKYVPAHRTHDSRNVHALELHFVLHGYGLKVGAGAFLDGLEITTTRGNIVTYHW